MQSSGNSTSSLSLNTSQPFHDPVYLPSSSIRLTHNDSQDASNTDKPPHALYVARPSPSRPHQAQSQTQSAKVDPPDARIVHIPRVERGCKGTGSRWGRINRRPAPECIRDSTREISDASLVWGGVSASLVRPRFLGTLFWKVISNCIFLRCDNLNEYLLFSPI
jgi:hypothetical protein